MATYTKLQGSNIRQIAGRYDLEMVDYEAIAAGAANSSYLLRAQGGSYVLTVFDDRSLGEVIELGRLLLFLQEQEFPTTRLLPATSGEMAITCKGKPVMVKEYVAGRVYRRLDKLMLHQVGAAMARLHQVAAPDFLPSRPTYGLRKFAAVQGQSIDTAYEDWISQRLPYLEQQRPGSLPRGLIHGDVFYDNVLFEGAKLKAVIDFEEATYEDMALDLGMGIVGLCREGATVALAKARWLVDGYEQIRVLEVTERETLQFFVEYAATAVSCWRYWKYHVDGPIAEKADKHRQMVRVAQEVCNIPQARFAETVFG